VFNPDRRRDARNRHVWASRPRPSEDDLPVDPGATPEPLRVGEPAGRPMSQQDTGPLIQHYFDQYNSAPLHAGRHKEI
jgi:hypothetical protein